MALLLNHLDQINLTAQSIGELEFARSRPFTNALLHNLEITALIRDTEPHERGLFSVDPNIRHSNGQARASNYAGDSHSRRKTANLGNQPPSSAVARVLGYDLLRKIQSSNRETSRGRGVDIELLLEGAEKLCAAFDVSGTKERVTSLRERHEQIIASIQFYEGKISRQQSSLSRFEKAGIEESQLDVDDAEKSRFTADETKNVTDDDVKAEEEVINELENRKRLLESRVADMDRDLGGLRG